MSATDGPSAEQTASSTATTRTSDPARDWWRRLTHPERGDPAALARLRRARSPVEALSIPAALELARRVGATRRGPDDSRLRAAADLGRVLAHVRDDDSSPPMRAAGWKKFAGMRRDSDAGEDRPTLSEVRFRRLLETGDGEEKVAAFARLVALMGGTISVRHLAADFLDWNHPTRGDRVRERWAFEYYHAADATPADPTTIPEDDDA